MYQLILFILVLIALTILLGVFIVFSTKDLKASRRSLRYKKTAHAQWDWAINEAQKNVSLITFRLAALIMAFSLIAGLTIDTLLTLIKSI